MLRIRRKGSNRVALGNCVKLKISIEDKIKQTAVYLETNIRAVSCTKIKVGLCVFVLAMSVLSFLSIRQSFERKGNINPVKIDKIETPKHWKIVDPTKPSNNGLAFRRDYKQLQMYQRLLDSLKLHKRTKYDSLLLARPKLLDSIQLLKYL